MPTVTTQLTETFIIRLTPQEAELLAGLVQNSHPADAVEVSRFKEELFNALKGA